MAAATQRTHKKSKRRVEHILFNPDNTRQARDLKEMGAPEGGPNYIIQYFEGKPSGYINFTLEKDQIDVNNIYVRPEYRDTTQMKERASGEELEKITENIFKIARGRRASELPEPAQGMVRRRMAQHGRKRLGIEKREKQLFLAAKMLRSVAKKYGKPLTTAATTPKGERMVRKYMVKYNEAFFSRRGAHKPRPGRGKSAKRRPR